jgi:hypothetical protein
VGGGSQLLLKQKTVSCLSVKFFLEHPIESVAEWQLEKAPQNKPLETITSWLAGWLACKLS